MRISDWSSDVFSSDLVRNGAVPFVMHENARSGPIAIHDIHHFQMQVVEIEPQSFGPLGKQHGLAMFEPELPQIGILLFGEIHEHILVVDDAVLEDFDEAGALMCMGDWKSVG